MIEVLPYTSKEIRAWSVSMEDDNGQTRDPTEVAVQVAFPTMGQDPSSWVSATWNVDMSTDPDTFWVEVLLSGTGGGGTVELAKGVYDVWIRLQDGGQAPTRHAVTLVVN